MKKLYFSLLLIPFFCTGCMTASLSMVHTEGTASDVVDSAQTQSPETTANPNISVPVSALPSIPGVSK